MGLHPYLLFIFIQQDVMNFFQVTTCRSNSLFIEFHVFVCLYSTIFTSQLDVIFYQQNLWYTHIQSPVHLFTQSPTGEITESKKKSIILILILTYFSPDVFFPLYTSINSVNFFIFLFYLLNVNSLFSFIYDYKKPFVLSQSMHVSTAMNHSVMTKLFHF